MAEAAATIVLKPVVDEVVKGISPSIKRQFNYLCCFTANADDLEKEAKKLDDAIIGVRGHVESEKDDALVIVPAVETWITESNDFKDTANGILNEVPNVKSGCFKLSARYSVSKKAMKTTEAVKEHLQKWTGIASSGISHPKPPAAAVQIPSAGTPYEFQSRKQIEEEIMTSLKGDDKDMIGIYGMGGLGKTTMANKIRNRVLEEHLFDEVVMAVVSKQVDESNIQQQIAEQLGVNLVEQTLMARAHRVRERLNDSKRTLLILDDVWEGLKLVELGIPCDSDGSRILFTSRNSGVLREMDVGKVFGMEILSEEEAWMLFRENAGICMDDTKLNTIAKEVVKECRGLPITLVTHGAAMKNVTDEGIWDDSLKKLKEANPVNVPQVNRPAAEVQIPSAGTQYEFQSRKHIEEEIMTSLKGDHREMIGIFGMGGLGKTTMANKIRNKALEEHLFDEVVMAVVSQQVDESKIQQQIAEQLGLNLQEQTLMARAHRVRERLNDSKRTLLILDDVWERLKLVELGIPCGSEGCRILFTSRNSDALSGMDVGKVFGMQILSKEEAWLLFKGKAGTCVDDMRLNSIAKEVVEECRGLPLAVVTVGAAMKDEMGEGIWKDSLKQLRKANPKNIPYFIEEVYNPLEVSIIRLGSEEAKSLCLLCCLFPEDDNICVDRLTYFCMGLHILEDVKRLEDARDRMRALIKLLKSRSLLLDGDEDYVRMHDVVRDVCTFIAKQKGYIGGNECNWISSFERSELPVGLKFPNLRLLFLTEHYFSDEDEQMKININNFFEGIRDLYVLSMKRYLWTSLPPTPAQSLKNLRTLILETCSQLKTISVVGYLVNLEILICRYCYTIKELPVEIGRLNRLKVLDLSFCMDLQSIGRGIISSLVGLEELKMERSFKKWEAEDIKERKNAGLKELESLTNLTCLEIDIEDAALAALNMRLSSKLQMFQITVGGGRKSARRLKSINFGREIELYWKEGTSLGHWIQMQLLRDIQRLYLRGNGVNNLELEKIPYNIFTNLTLIHIKDCPHLHNLGQLSIAGIDCLPHLEVLIIRICKVIEQVFLWNQEREEENKNDDITKILFPKLKEVELYSLPNLTTFCQGIEGIEFPLLEVMRINGCPKLTSMISSYCVNRIGSNENNSGGTINEDHSSHLFCQQQKVSFVSLKILSISAVDIENPLCCRKIPMSFFNGLKELSIGDCSEMEEVIKEEEKTVSGGQRRTLVFPNLLRIILKDLPKLVIFCESKCDVELPSLTSMEIHECPNMTNFTLGLLIAPKWEAWDTNFRHRLDVSSWNIKYLKITKAEYPLCHYQISDSFFTRLDKLSISLYDGMSLFSSTIARNLVNLRALHIGNSHKIIHVIKDDDEKEKVVSGGAKTPLFPKLEILELDNLSKLVTFSEWNCDIELPSLKRVMINYCPNMRNLTLGLLTTPILSNIIIDYKDVGATKNLNGLLQQR